MKNNNPLVSIIIPVYNSERYIANSIESAASQTYSEIEIIIVDDGSTDHSREVIKAYESGNIICIEQSNSGSAAARNTGIVHSKGAYIQFLDADDILPKNKIENQIRFMQKYNIGLSYTGWMGVHGNNVKRSFVPQNDYLLSYSKYLSDTMSGRMTVYTHCWLTARDLIIGAGLWCREKVNNPIDDYEYFVRVFEKASVAAYVPGSPVVYRIHEGNAVSRYSDELAEESRLKTYLMVSNIVRKYRFYDAYESVVLGLSKYIIRNYPYKRKLTKRAKKEIIDVYKSRITVEAGKYRIYDRLVGWKIRRLLQRVVRYVKNVFL